MSRYSRPALVALVVATSALTACSAPEDPTPAHSYAQQAPSANATAGSVDGDVPVTAAGAPQQIGAAAAPRGTVTRTVAPTPTTDDGTRILRIPAQKITAAVFNCSTENGIVTPPPMVKDVCWWTGSRPLDAAQGVSIVVGHSTRSNDSTGALERTRYLPIGSVVTLAGQTWKVAQIETDVDKHGLPPWITYATGPRMLGLITCDLTNHKSNVLVRLVPA